MRSTVLTYIGFFVIMIQLFILGTITTKSCYQQTIEQSVEASMDMAVNMLQKGYKEHLEGLGYVIDTTEIEWSDATQISMAEWKKQFIEYLAANVDSRITNLDVELYAADTDNGVLSVNVTATYTYLNGRVGTVSCYRTLALNNVQ